jgi:hypothetical protein
MRFMLGPIALPRPSTEDLLASRAWTVACCYRLQDARWKAARALHNKELYFVFASRRGLHSDKRAGAGAPWGCWEAKPVLRCAPSGENGSRSKVQWEIDSDNAKGPTIHGPHGTGVLTRWADGYDTGQISNDIGMSRQMVDHYMMASRPTVGGASGWSRQRDRRRWAMALYRAGVTGPICKTSAPDL